MNDEQDDFTEHVPMEKLSAERKENDLKLWEAWRSKTKETGDGQNEHLAPLLSSVGRASTDFVRRYGGKTDIPEAVLHNRAMDGVLKAITTYNPSHSKGAALYSYVVTEVANHCRRFINERQGPGHRIPEHRAWGKITEYKSALEEYELKHGHEPSDAQLAEFMRKPESYIRSMRIDQRQSAPGLGSLIEDNVTMTIPKESRAVERVKFLLHGTPDGELAIQVLELFLNNKNGQTIARTLGINSSKVSSLRTKVVRMLKEELGKR